MCRICCTSGVQLPSVCRRAERSLVALSQKETVSPRGLAYLNRLSTLLFWWAVLASNPEV